MNGVVIIFDPHLLFFPLSPIHCVPPLVKPFSPSMKENLYFWIISSPLKTFNVEPCCGTSKSGSSGSMEIRIVLFIENPDVGTLMHYNFHPCYYYWWRSGCHLLNTFKTKLDPDNLLTR